MAVLPFGKLQKLHVPPMVANAGSTKPLYVVPFLFLSSWAKVLITSKSPSIDNTCSAHHVQAMPIIGADPFYLITTPYITLLVFHLPKLQFN